jgi:hypothetical protein
LRRFGQLVERGERAVGQLLVLVDALVTLGALRFLEDEQGQRAARIFARAGVDRGGRGRARQVAFDHPAVAGRDRGEAPDARRDHDQHHQHQQAEACAQAGLDFQLGGIHRRSSGGWAKD